MENASSSQTYNCFPATICTFVIIISITSLPFHGLMIKVLLSDLRLALPRHSIMLCLTVSDAWQVLASFSCVMATHIFNLMTLSGGCTIAMNVFYFNIAMTLVVSSLSIALLSVERYVACIHSFRLHEIFTSERMIYVISCMWIIGVLCGTVTVTLAEIDRQVVSIEDNEYMKIIAVLFIFPTSILISGIQYHLMIFSRRKLVHVMPVTMSGSEGETDYFRKRQIKVAFVAGIVAIAYIVCLLPMGFSSFYDLITGTISPTEAQAFMKALAFLNNIANPCIYGIGVVDTRRALLKNLKRILDRVCST